MAVEQKTYLINVKDNLDKYAKRAVDADKAVTKFVEANKKLLASGDKSSKEYQKAASELRRLQKERKDEKKQLDLATQAYNANTNSRKQLNAMVTLEQRRLGALSNTISVNSKGVRVLSQEYINQVKALSQAKGAVIAYDQAQKDGRSNVGRYSQSLVGMGKNLLQTMGIFTSAAIVVRAFFNVIKKGFKTTWEFEKAMSMVRAITGATADEIERLTKSAITLGSATKFTATEVAGLQKEYAKLGFSTDEILAITQATLDLAAATGSDLGQASQVAGATLRQFALDATQMQRVVDVMAKSFSTSALDMQKFQDSMKSAGPVAAAVGETVESTTAKLGILANAGLDASTSGTSLRNIFLRLAKAGLTWDQAMKKVAGSEDKASTALKLFGVRSATAALILADSSEALEDYNTELLDVIGTSKEMSTIMLDNVAGSMTKLSSAWEGLTLRINESSGAMKVAIDLMTDIVSVSGTLGKGQQDFAALVDVKQIETFSDKLGVYAKIGIGKVASYMAAIITSKKQVLLIAQALSTEAKEELEWQEFISKERAKLTAEEKERKKKELQDIEASVAAAKEAEEAKEKAVIAAQKALEKEIELHKKLTVERRKYDAESDLEASTIDLELKRDKLLRETENAENILLIWENYYSALEQLQQTAKAKDITEEERKKQEALNQIEWEKNAELINQQNLLQIRQLSGDYEFDIKRKQLEIREQMELDSIKKTGADRKIIEDKYAAARMQLEELEAQAKLDLYAGFAGNLATIFGKNTAIGKAAAVASAAISTYQAANLALATYPPPFSFIAAAAAIVSGLANVKKIVEIKSGLPGEDSVSAPTVITNMVSRQIAPRANIFTQPQLSQEQLNAVPNEGILTAEDIAEAVSKLPNPIVSVEDINARTQEVEKVEVQANI